MRLPVGGNLHWIPSHNVLSTNCALLPNSHENIVPPMSYSRADGLRTARSQVGLHPLSDPNDPYVELIFVHGLMGDSHWTWTVENDNATFWPDWLAEDRLFMNTRIHTYGYHEPTVQGRVPVSKIRDIGISMCTALEHNNQLRGAAHVRIKRPL